MNNKAEVGFTPDDNNNIRLSGSVNLESSFSPSSDFAKNTPLDTGDTCGVIGQPFIGGDYVPTPIKSASVTGPTGLVETTASTENLAAKYKYPNISQDIPEKGRPGVQYNDHT
jgi:hypothetical protein